jgi:hypothetical protein
VIQCRYALPKIRARNNRSDFRNHRMNNSTEEQHSQYATYLGAFEQFEETVASSKQWRLPVYRVRQWYEQRHMLLVSRQNLDVMKP